MMLEKCDGFLQRFDLVKKLGLMGCHKVDHKVP